MNKYFLSHYTYDRNSKYKVTVKVYNKFVVSENLDGRAVALLKIENGDGSLTRTNIYGVNPQKVKSFADVIHVLVRGKEGFSYPDYSAEEYQIIRLFDPQLAKEHYDLRMQEINKICAVLNVWLAKHPIVYSGRVEMQVPTKYPDLYVFRPRMKIKNIKYTYQLVPSFKDTVEPDLAKHAYVRDAHDGMALTKTVVVNMGVFNYPIKHLGSIFSSSNVGVRNLLLSHQDELTKLVEGQELIPQQEQTPLTNAPGGIDFKADKFNLDVRGNNAHIPFNIDPAQLQNIQFDGLTPNILQITPVESLALFLGWDNSSTSNQLNMTKY